MIVPTLTQRLHGATLDRPARVLVWLTAIPMLAGCIQITAPEKPIEINLNVNVRQEVVVRLQKDAEDFIQSNPELFPQ